MNWDRVRFWYWLSLLVLSPIAILVGGYFFVTTKSVVALMVLLASVLTLAFSYKYFTEPL